MANAILFFVKKVFRACFISKSLFDVTTGKNYLECVLVSVEELVQQEHFAYDSK